MIALGLPEAALERSKVGPSGWDYSQEGKSPRPGPSGPGRSPGSLPISSQY